MLRKAKRAELALSQVEPSSECCTACELYIYKMKLFKWSHGELSMHKLCRRHAKSQLSTLISMPLTEAGARVTPAHLPNKALGFEMEALDKPLVALTTQ